MHKVLLCRTTMALCAHAVRHWSVGGSPGVSRCARRKEAVMDDRELTPRARRLLTGRQERRPGSPRMIRHVVKVTPDQESRLLLRAAERRITVARLMVEASLTGNATAAQTKAELAGELYRLSRLLGKIGVNINQIARASNVTLELQPDTGPAIEALGRVCTRLNLLLDDVENQARP